MPNVQKLSQEEVQAFENKGKGQRKLIESVSRWNIAQSITAPLEYFELIVQPLMKFDDQNR